MTPEEKYELFERKISNEISIEEDQLLSQIIKDDQAIAQEFKTYQEWNSYLSSNLGLDTEKAQLANNLKNISDTFFTKETQKTKSKVIKMPSWGYAVAASVLVLLGVYTFTKSTTPIYNDFVSIPELSISERADTNEIGKKAEEAFNSNNYKEAEVFLNQLLEEDKSNSEYLFYYGISLVELDEFEKASEVFTTLQNGTSIYKYRAIWFEALNQLKQKNTDKCKVLLELIPKEAEDYQTAQELLEEL